VYRSTLLEVFHLLARRLYGVGFCGIVLLRE